MFNRQMPLLLLASVLAAGSAAVVTAQGKGGRGGGNTTTTPTIATFHTDIDGVTTAIQDDGGGPLFDGQDGVKSIRVTGSTSTNGWTWNLFAKRSRTPRSLVYNLTMPVDGAADFGIHSVNDTHGQVYNLSTIAAPPGGSADAFVHAAFHFFVDGTEYVVRFGRENGVCGSLLKVTRTADTDTFWVRTDPDNPDGDIACLMEGNGPGEVLLGYYHVPLSLQLESQ